MAQVSLRHLSAAELLERLRPAFDFGAMYELLRRLQDPALAGPVYRLAVRTLDAGLLARRLLELKELALAGDLRAAVLVVRCVHPVRGVDIRQLMHAVVSGSEIAHISATIRHRTDRSEARPRQVVKRPES